MSILISLDPGSNHMGKLKYALEMIDVAADVGADVIKFQMFKHDHPGVKHGNIPIDRDWWPHLEKRAYDKKIGIACSFFDKESYEFCFSKNLKYMKFAYSMQGETEWIKSCLAIGKMSVVSTDQAHISKIPSGAIKLFCYAEKQPNGSEWNTKYGMNEMLNFHPLFPPFDGLSDHTIGYNQTEDAVVNGARYIEKHMTLKYADINCPDTWFSLGADDLQKMIHAIRRIQL